jgi:cytochrome P450
MRSVLLVLSVERSLDDRLTALFASEPDAMAVAPALFRELREQSPVHRHASAVLFSRYADARALVRDEEHLGKSRLKGTRASREAVARMTEVEQRAYTEVTAFEGLQVTAKDGEEHDRMRAIMHRAMTPSRIAALEDSVQRYTDELLEPLLDQDPADLMSFAYLLPLMVICDLLGIPQSDRALIHDWSTAIGRNKGPVPYPEPFLAAQTAIREFRSYLEAMLAEHRRSPHSTDLLAALMSAEGDDRLTTDELASNFVMLLFAGHETTTNLIGIGMLELLQHPDQWQLLRDDPDLAPQATEELLRYVTPVQWSHRLALQDFEYGGVEISEGEVVLAMIAAGNRDPEVFDDPERLDLTRDARGHLSLGHGTHFCLGASLARLEGRAAFATLARRFPELELATDTFHWRGSSLLRSLESLPVSFGA